MDQEESPSTVPTPQFRGNLNKADRDAAVLSIASSFMSVRYVSFSFPPSIMLSLTNVSSLI